jgi:hypothetical protein
MVFAEALKSPGTVQLVPLVRKTVVSAASTRCGFKMTAESDSAKMSVAARVPVSSL